MSHISTWSVLKKISASLHKWLAAQINNNNKHVAKSSSRCLLYICHSDNTVSLTTIQMTSRRHFRGYFRKLWSPQITYSVIHQHNLRFFRNNLKSHYHWISNINFKGRKFNMQWVTGHLSLFIFYALREVIFTNKLSRILRRVVW